MHELALMESVVDELVGRFEHDRIVVVRLEIGRLSGVDVEALRFCFGVCVDGTPLAGAALDIERTPARALCRGCGREEPTDSLASPCSCGSFDRELRAGNELRLKEVEVV
jgi:hydrogenase nickel incorporation protein HypA/HybF